MENTKYDYMDNNNSLENEKEASKIVNEMQEVINKEKNNKELKTKRILGSVVLGFSFFTSLNLFTILKTQDYVVEATKEAKVEKIYNVYDARSKQNYVFSETNVKGLIVDKIKQNNEIVLDQKAKELKTKATYYINKEQGSDFTLEVSKYLRQLDSKELFSYVHIYIKEANKDSYKTRKIEDSESYLKDGLKDEVLLDTKNMSAYELYSINLDEISKVKIQLKKFNGYSL